MNRTLDTLKRRATLYGRYRRLVHELRTMPLDVALDLDIYQGDAEDIARRAVYGA